MRTVAALFVSVFALAAAAQPERPWYDSREEIARLHAPSGSFGFVLSSVWVELLLPNTQEAIVYILLRHPPIRFSINSRPELASLLTTDESKITPVAFDTFSEGVSRLLMSYESTGLPERFKERLHESGVRFRLATPEELRLAQDAIRGLPAIGRFLAIRMSEPLTVIAVGDLAYGIHPVESLSVADGYVLIDIGAFAEHAKPFDPLSLNTFTRGDSGSRSLMREYVERMGEQYWDRLPQTQKDEFTDRFGPVGTGQPGAMTQPRPSRFIEAYVIAVLYPTTFATQPVGTFSIPGSRAPGLLTGELLERVHYVDALLDPIERAFLDSIPESAFEPPVAGDE